MYCCWSNHRRWILATVGAAATNPFLGVATGYSSACAIIEVWEWALE